LGDLSTPNSVQKLQTALHAKAKAEPGYRFYALYDKISREDILAHAYAQCRSNKGAPGVDRQDFEAVEAYGVERWLGELALALRQETSWPRHVSVNPYPVGTPPSGPYLAGGTTTPLPLLRYYSLQMRLSIRTPQRTNVAQGRGRT
jgi:hypothetical protein